MTLLLRFVIGGVVVSLCAFLADLVKPKSVAGLFGAAPAVALATLLLTIRTDGKTFAAEEARAMIAGAAAFFLYARVCVWLMMKFRREVLEATVYSFAAWFPCVFLLWLLFLK
jgi:uncharacterized membrane protein (GlpM family)